MRGRSSFEYAVIRVVPRVERGEFINVGIVLYCRARSFLDARVALDEPRLTALAPTLILAKFCATWRRFSASAGASQTRGQWGGSRSASGSTGWSRRAAPSYRPRPPTPGCATIPLRRWSV